MDTTIQLIIVSTLIIWLTTVEIVYRYKSKKIRAYNKGYQAGYEATLKQAMDYAKMTTKDMCDKYSSQFSGRIERMPIPMARKVNEIAEPFTGSMQTFHVDTYSVSFMIEPKHHEYATYVNGKI